MANQVYASPGVYTSEKDISFTAETVGVTTLGLVGETLKGPAFQPMFVQNYEQFKLAFGGTSPQKFLDTQIVKYELPYIAKSYLSQSNQLFVTRVLGLSGYNSGAAYAIRTMGSIDQTTLTRTTGTTTYNFTYNLTGGTLYVSGTTTNLIDAVATGVSVSSTKFATAFASFFNTATPTTYTSTNWYKNNIFYWGVFETADQTLVTADRNTRTLTTSGSTALLVDGYALPITIPASDEINYILNNEYSFNETSDEFTGYSFAMFAYDITGVSASVYSGKLKVNKYTYTATPNAEFHKKTVAIMRSRGSYVVDNLEYTVTGTTTVGYSSITSAMADPYASFNVSGTTAAGTNFDYSLSMDRTKGNYLKKVLGVDAFDKSSALFVDEVYDASLAKGFAFGKVKGLYSDLLDMGDWDHKEFQYQSPITPFFVSELRGGLPQRLFRLVSISDGESANTEIKVSIANVNLNNLTFDVQIRAFNDSDKAPVFLEKFLAASMDESKTNYIGKLIGTIDNKYPLLSSYVVVDLDPNAPADAIPAGFEGYEFRTNNITGTTATDHAGIIEMPYKAKYYAPGDLIVDPVYSTAIYSLGDRVRKVYLGFTDTEFGFDKDLLKFKGQIALSGNAYNEGLPWSTRTTGFHMDVDASGITDSVTGELVFTSGVGSFVDASEIEADSTHAYHDIKTRKFTALFAGGFDGWDIYRTSRTNLNDYKVGRGGFTRSGFTTFASSEFSDEYGMFGTSDYYATFLGILTYQNPEETTINIMATPGIDIINNSDLVVDAIEMVQEKRMDSIYLPTLPDIQLLGNSDPGNQDTWYFPNDIINALETTDIDSNYTAVYYPWIQINDSENNANLFIPPTAEVVRNLAYTDNVAYPWFATAGYNRGIVNCIRARMPLDQNTRDILYPARINPIATFSDVGTIIWGNRNLQTKNSALNRLNIRRLLLQARKLIVSVANRLLFDPNDTTVRSQFLSLVNPILDNIRKERGLTDFRVTLSNDATEIDRNTMKGRIFIKPTPTLEFIELEFTVTPTSVSFDNIT